MPRIPSQTRPLERWPSGDSWTAAFLDEAAVEGLGLEFEQGKDDLDSYLLAAIADSQIGQFWIFRRDHSPEPSWELVVDASVRRDDALSALWRELRLDTRSMPWINPLSALPRVDLATR